MFNPEKIGASAAEVIGALLKVNPDIAELSVFEPNVAQLAQQRLKDDPGSHQILEAGLRLRQQVGLPFWDAILVSCFGAGASAYQILDQAGFHNPPPKWKVSVRRAQWSAAFLADLDVTPGRMLVVSSRVSMTDGEYRHIPMLDFHCPPSPENQKLAEHVAYLVGPRGGYLLQSDKSYHFYGAGLMLEQELPVFLGRALLFCPVADRPWIAHQLIEGACGLRISTKIEGGVVPRVVAELGPRDSPS